MAGFIYVGSDDPGENSICEVFGLTFPKGEAVDVAKPEDIQRLTANPMFTAVDAKKPASPAS